jgi:hypothetical protein
MRKKTAEMTVRTVQSSKNYALKVLVTILLLATGRRHKNADEMQADGR